MATINRRDFLKALGVTGGATALSACGIDDNRYLTPVEQVLPYVIRPEQVTPGTPTFFATTAGDGPDAHPVLARHREGRVIHVGANQRTPVGPFVPKSALLELQRAYSPDRYQGPMLDNAPTDWEKGLARFSDAVKSAVASGKKVAYLGGYRSGAIVSLIQDFTGGNATFWEPLGYEADAIAVAEIFGARQLPAYDLKSAQYVLSFGAAFLSGWGGWQLAADYAVARNPNHGKFVARFAAVAPFLDQTSSNCDDWHAASAGSEALVALAVAKLVASTKGYNGPLSAFVAGGDVAKAAAASGLSTEAIEAIAGHFAHAPAAVALPGGVSGASKAAVDLAKAVFALNIVSGNLGKTFGLGGYTAPVNGYADVAALISAMGAGQVGVLVLDDTDPVYALPAAAGFVDALAKVGLVVSLSSFPSQTSAAAALVLPSSSVFEDWGDAMPRDGLHLLRQPGMLPLYDTRGVGDILLSVAKAAGLQVAATEGEAVASLGFAPASWREYLMSAWERTLYPTLGFGMPFQRWWEQRLGDGFAGETQLRSADVQAIPAGLSAVELGGDGAFNLVVYPHAHAFDGRHANEPWAQETPDPTSGNVWDSWLVMHPAAAEKLGVTENDLVEIATSSGKLQLAVELFPEVREDTVAIAYGNGHTANGRYANGTGVSVVNLLGAVQGAGGVLAWQQAKANIKSVGTLGDLASTFGSDTDQGRQLSPVANAVQLATSGDDDSGTEQMAGWQTGVHHLPRDPRLVASGDLDFYGLPDHPVYRWGMSVDINACNGCGTCAIACSAENNLAVVGKKRIQQQREMSWVRINRYLGDRSSDNMESMPRETRYMPVMCQQCGHAPCESVCPVLATYHTQDGLNAMIYNRCAGTRYCANACPFKARRFNWHSFQWPESFNLQLNPDATVRTMGVMEKCTFCVQRIKATVSAYRDRGFSNRVPSADVEQLPACAEGCPTGAITFGNINEKDSSVAKSRRSSRSFQMLAELNVFAGVNYLARASFHVPERSQHHGGGHAAAPGATHEATPAHEAPAAHEETH